MTTTTHICGPCGNPDCRTDHTGGHAPTLTASARTANGIDIAVVYEDTLTAVGYDLPMDTPGPDAMTAGAGPNLAGPYATVPDEDLGKRVLTSVATGEVLYGLLRDGLSPRSAVRANLDAILRAIGPTALRRKVAPYELVEDQIRACGTVAALEREFADFQGPIVAAASMTPLGQQGRPVIDEPSTSPGPPSDPYNVLQLTDDDLISSLIRDLAMYRQSRNWLMASRAANTLADQVRAKAIESGQLIDDGLTAGGTPIPVYTIDARGDRDGSLGAMAALAVEERRRGDLQRAQSWAKGLVSELEQEAEDAAQAEFDAIVAQRDAELPADELQARRTKRLVARAIARRQAEYDAIAEQRQAEIASGG